MTGLMNGVIYSLAGKQEETKIHLLNHRKALHCLSFKIFLKAHFEQGWFKQNPVNPKSLY